eukprot:gene29217-38286_t
MDRYEHRPDLGVTPVDVDHLDLAYRYAVSFKQLHPGFDCLVTATNMLAGIISYLDDIVVGYPPVGYVLSLAARHVDPTCFIVRGMHGTFHVGSRNGNWSSSSNGQKWSDINGRIASKIYRRLAAGNNKGILQQCRTVQLKLSEKLVNGCYTRKQIPLFPPDADKFLFPEDFQMLMERRKDMTAQRGKQHSRIQ